MAIRIEAGRVWGHRRQGGRSRLSLLGNGKDFNRRFPTIARALESLPDETVIDGEIVAVDADGKPSFKRLQNFESAGQTILFYAFDLLALAGRDVRQRPLIERRDLLRELIMGLPEPIRLSETFDVPIDDLIRVVRQNGLEGVVAKRRDSFYRSGERNGDWLKMRVNRGQEFVIGGYVPSGNTFDSILVGHYDGSDLLYAARIRAGFVPALRQAVFTQFKGLSLKRCPFSNLPERIRVASRLSSLLHSMNIQSDRIRPP